MSEIDLLETVALIKAFSLGKSSENNSAKLQYEHQSKASRATDLAMEKSCTFPPELNTYIDALCPSKTLTFNGVGHPVTLLSRDTLSWEMDGYNFNAQSKQVINGWHDNWFLIATEGGEPIIVKLDEHRTTSTVYSAMQADGVWDFYPIADSIGAFLLCAAALEHAMNFPGIEQPLDDDFNLADGAAKWLFPLIMKYAEPYYDEWVSVFENYKI